MLEVVWSESLSFIIESMYLMRTSPVLPRFGRVIPWLHHRFYLYQIYICGREEIGIKSVDCGE